MDAPADAIVASTPDDDHLTLLLDLTTEINAGAPLERVFALVAGALREIFSIDRFAVVLEQEDGELRLTSSRGLSGTYLENVEQRIAEGAGARALRQRRPMWIPDAQTSADFWPLQEAAHIEGFHTVLILPLFSGTDPLGYLIMYHNDMRTYTGPEVVLAQAVAQQAAMAVQNARVLNLQASLELARERSRSNLLTELLDISAFLNSDLSISTLMERVVETAMTIIGARSGTLGLIEHDRLVFRRFHLPTGWTDFDVVLKRGEGAPGYVWETMQPYLTNDCEKDPRVMSVMQKRLGFQRLVTVPMVDRAGKLVGTLGVYDPIDGRDFVQTDIEILELLANQAAITIENAQLNQLKDEFLSIVSHELKTPVTSIKGFTQVLQRRLPSEALESSGHYLDVINHQANRLTGLINDLLDLSRIQTGRFCFDMEVMDLAQLIREVVDEMRLVSTQNEIVTAIPQVAEVNGNVERLRQVVVNLVDNAIKHGPRNSPVTVTVEVTDSEVYTFVCDEGQGIPNDEAERIFRPYYQMRHHPRQQAKGLGLGLFISRQIIDEHQGRIWLDTNDHTSFCFVLPRV